MPRPRYLAWSGHARTLSAWAKKLGLSKQLISSRLKRGWPLSEVLSKKLRAPGSRGYADDALSDVQRHALGVLSDGKPHSAAELVHAPNSRYHHLAKLLERGFAERRGGKYCITALGEKARVKDQPERFVGTHRPAKRRRARARRARRARASRTP